MSNWNCTKSYLGNDHQRRASIAGYNGSVLIGYDNEILAPFWIDNRGRHQHYSSYMDVSRRERDPTDRKYSWKSEAQNSELYLKPERSFQLFDKKPFESTFKAAIYKMKATSISRLCAVDDDVRSNPPEPYYNDDPYNRNCMTFPTQRIVSDSKASRHSHKIYRCNPGTGGERDKISSTSTDSESKSDNTNTDNHFQSVRNLYPLSYQYQVTVPNKTDIIPRQKTSRKELILHSNSSIIIPKLTNSYSHRIEANSSAIKNVCISQKNVYKSQSSSQKPSHYNNDKRNIIKVDPIPYAYDITTTQGTPHFGKRNSITVILNCQSTIKPPPKVNQRPLDGQTIPFQGELLNVTSKEMPGFYKKSNLKGKSISNIPANFNKLHYAFLEQKKEIKALKVELEEKKAYIHQLESEIRSYESWQ